MYRTTHHGRFQNFKNGVAQGGPCSRLGYRKFAFFIHKGSKLMYKPYIFFLAHMQSCSLLQIYVVTVINFNYLYIA